MTDLYAKRVVAHPDSEARAQRYADQHELPLQLLDLLAPGTVYVFDPAKLSIPDVQEDER
jgi:hypothetical protein